MDEAPDPHRVAQPLAMSEAEDDMPQARGTDLGESTSFVPAAHVGIPVDLPGQYQPGRYGRMGKDAHPPLDCPAPRYPATLRGFYRCPACGLKVPLTGTRRGAEIGAELGERWTGALFCGVAQAFWFTWDLAVDVARGVAWLYRKLRVKEQNSEQTNGGVAPDLVSMLVVLSIAAARYGRGSEAPGPASGPTRDHEIGVVSPAK
jgi:hypothetical protein